MDKEKLLEMIEKIQDNLPATNIEESGDYDEDLYLFDVRYYESFHCEMNLERRDAVRHCKNLVYTLDETKKALSEMKKIIEEGNK